MLSLCWQFDLHISKGQFACSVQRWLLWLTRCWLWYVCDLQNKLWLNERDCYHKYSNPDKHTAPFRQCRRPHGLTGSPQKSPGCCHLAHKPLDVCKWVLPKQLEYAADLVTQATLIFKDRHHRPRRRRRPGRSQSSADLSRLGGPVTN